jgi:capsular exopolysaccharide synthesis family protein
LALSAGRAHFLDRLLTNDPANLLTAPARPGALDRLPGAGQRGEFLRLMSKLRDIQGKDAHFAICFTSALPGEGCSTMAAQFACAVAQSGAGEKVLLIDGNLRHPNLHELLEVDDADGVLDVCMAGVPADQAIQSTELEDLDVLTAGNRNQSPNPDFLNPLRFRDLIRSLVTQYDLVVVDAPPVAMGTAATHLSKEDAATLLVVQASQTRREVIQGSIHELKLMAAHVAGVVLNRRRYFIPSFVYRRL